QGIRDTLLKCNGRVDLSVDALLAQQEAKEAESSSVLQNCASSSSQELEQERKSQTDSSIKRRKIRRHKLSERSVEHNDEPTAVIASSVDTEPFKRVKLVHTRAKEEAIYKQ